ncbi:transposase [Bradyrhizobium diazoefficiens]|nr:transposase [Bradyrhizobium diazoefficiens]
MTQENYSARFSGSTRSVFSQEKPPSLSGVRPPRAPRRLPSLPPPNRANQTAGANSRRDKAWGQAHRTTKIHAVTDDQRRPRVLLLSPANINNIALAPALAAAVGPIERLITDKAWDANSLRKLLAEHGAKAVIPSTASRSQPILTAKRSIASATLSSACSPISRTLVSRRTSASSEERRRWLLDRRQNVFADWLVRGATRVPLSPTPGR